MEHGIHATSRLIDSHLDRVVATSVAKVGDFMLGRGYWSRCAYI